ncbi:MAG: ATP-binding domain-containing protein, partial [Flavobacteriales bacterium]|nr:ATP-binding domain-containing protein [Flavobacteriales bacterium]
CKSNKRAYLYNQQIRHKILWKEERISNGDYLMVVRNNYSWLDEDSKAGFIANGDTVKVKHIRKYEELYGFNFAHITIELVDYPEEPEIDVIVMLDTLESEQAALDYERYKELYNLISQDYNSIKNTYKRNKAIKEDKYLNALQIKYAYAITCHKSQGGQWKSVFVEQSYFTNEMLNKEYLRWLYTSLTRASEKLHLINFSDKFFH